MPKKNSLNCTYFERCREARSWLLEGTKGKVATRMESKPMDRDASVLLLMGVDEEYPQVVTKPSGESIVWGRRINATVESHFILF